MLKYMEGHRRFLHEYGSAGYQIIFAYEEACGIAHSDCYTNWFGDLGLFEASLNENVTYENLCERYDAGLKFLGIVREQAETICRVFLSSQLADHIKEEMRKSDLDASYRVQSILSKRKVFACTEERPASDSGKENHQTPKEFCEECSDADDVRNEQPQNGGNWTMGGLT